jgi:DNA primase
MVLKQHGFNAVALNGEGYGLSSDSYETIAPYITGLRKRFKKIVIFLDGDAAGVTFANKLSLRLKLPNIHLDPVFKDISDYQKHFGVVQTNRKIKKLLSKCLRT